MFSRDAPILFPDFYFLKNDMAKKSCSFFKKKSTVGALSYHLRRANINYYKPDLEANPWYLAKNASNSPS
jgi:hypothetical protein